MHPHFKEISCNFDADDVRPFLVRVSRLIDAGFAEGEVEQVDALLHDLEVNDVEDLEFPIHYAGQPTDLRLGIFMDDVESPDVYFSALPALIDAIGVEMHAYFGQLGR